MASVILQIPVVANLKFTIWIMRTPIVRSTKSFKRETTSHTLHFKPLIEMAMITAIIASEVRADKNKLPNSLRYSSNEVNNGVALESDGD
ncbi:MAG: hypothetical protein L0154_12830 [Chloroflexi bacterium]|nr:hypothetical protein [Chloroflexota bacterium]